MKHVFLLFFLILFSSATVAQSTHCEDAWYAGEGTQYGGIAGSAGGHCGIPVASGDIYHAAMNHEQYAASQACGACVRILGPKGEATVKIVDECPECKYGDIDVTTGVFPQLADLKDGRIKITWQYVPCPLAQDITVVFAPGSGPYYFKMQIRDFYYPIVKLEYKKSNGSYKTIQREVYNYFVAAGGIDENKQQTGPYNFRLTAITGQVLELTNILFSTTALVHTGKQFQDLNCLDCMGIAGGNAKLDNCGVCSGGTSGIIKNSTCVKDCAGYWEGTAYTDGCNKCVAGTTGATPCGLDCNGSPGGTAYKDKCLTCVGGTTGLQACKKDCNNDWGGTAFRDSCNVCAGGNTNLAPNLSTMNCGITTSTKISNHSNAVNIFPNPFTHQLNIENNFNTPIDVKILTCSGQVVREQFSVQGNIDTSNLATGLYIVVIIAEDEVYREKIEKR